MFELFISSFITMLLWCWVFVSSSALSSAIFYWLLSEWQVALLIGGSIGVIVAEFVRRKYGLVQFFGRLVAHKDIDGKHKSYKE